MTILRTVEVHLKWCWKLVGVDVCSPVARHDERPGRYRTTVREHRIGRDEPLRTRVHRRFPPQQLFDSVASDCRVVDQSPAVIGVRGEESEKACESVTYRVKAGDQKEEADVQELILRESFTVNSGRHKMREDILSGEG